MWGSIPAEGLKNCFLFFQSIYIHRTHLIYFHVKNVNELWMINFTTTKQKTNIYNNQWPCANWMCAYSRQNLGFLYSRLLTFVWFGAWHCSQNTSNFIMAECRKNNFWKWDVKSTSVCSKIQQIQGIIVCGNGSPLLVPGLKISV